MHLAERTKDRARAEAAMQQIETVLRAMRGAGHAPLAAYYEARLREARRIRDVIEGRS